MIVGTAGHIDHGKTSLIRALTGIDTDRLPEEKARGITLDLGFAYVPVAGGGVLGFVDVPGHERLVHTMIAGATSIEMALLVVAADDGVMPQTREHLQILTLLGVTRAVVALTKIDLIGPDRALDAELEVEALLEGTAFAGASIFPVSTVSGEGIAALRDSLLEEAARAAAPEPGAAFAFRLSVDRSFSLAGAGTVVTGSVATGAIAVGDTVQLWPAGARARVRGIHAANQAAATATAGQRCALNLAGPGIRKDTIGRGGWVLSPERDSATQRCDIVLRLLAGERAALKSGTPVLAHHGAGQTAARVLMLDPPALAPGGEGLAHLILDRALPVRWGDRLILRDISATRTLAGGVALDPRPPPRHRRRPARLAVLRDLAAANPRAAILAMLSHPPYLAHRETLRADWGLTEDGLAAWLPDAIPIGAFAAGPEGLSRLLAAIAAGLEVFHASDPGVPGMTGEALRLALPIRLPREAFAAVLAHALGAGAVVAEGHLIRSPRHRGGLAGEAARVWDRLRPLLAETPFRPPLLREAAAALGLPDVPLRRACKGLARLGLVVEMAPDRFFTREAAAEMAAIAHALSAESEGGWFPATAFRDRTGSGRQLAIQVLEYFDRRGVTARRGDLRRAGKRLFGETAA